MSLIRRPATAKGQLILHVLTYNGARLLLVCVAAGVILAVDALTSLDVPVVLVLLIALGVSLPLSAFALRKLRRTINADIEAVDRERAAKQRGASGGRTRHRNTVK
jgi:Flp pilus assembly protein TadB